jgi:hypothetical protein
MSQILLKQKSIFLIFYFMLAPLVGEIDYRLEMLARDEHSSLFIEIINYVAYIIETEKHLLCYLLYVEKICF